MSILRNNYLELSRLTGLMLLERDFDLKSIVPTTRLCRRGDLRFE